jgi:hypothetical protein
MKVGRRFVVSIVGLGAALLLSVPAAGAAMRFASPSGTSADPTCPQTAPCDIVTAINNASNGDDITIETGTYPTISTMLKDSSNTLTIHGQAGASRPVVTDSEVVAIRLSGEHSSLTDVEIDTTSASALGIQVLGGNGVTVDRVLSHAFGGSASACYLFSSANVTIANSLCVADGLSALALHQINGSSTLRNDTLEAPGGAGATGGVAAELSGSFNNTTTLALVNTIAHGAMTDLVAEADNMASTDAIITADHSNFANARFMHGVGGSMATVPVAGWATNQAAAPQFANPGIDDYHELAGSPTRGAGFSSPANGMLDLDGNPRQVGGSTDIGAYEFIGAAPSAPITVGAGPPPPGGAKQPPPSDSQPVLSTSTFAALSSGPSVIAAAAKGTIISYTDTQAATTTFVVRKPAGKGVLSRGKCVIRPKGKGHGKSCTRYTSLGSFSHTDVAGANRFRFTGRVSGRKLKPGRYQLLSTPTNSAGVSGAMHINNFTIVR